MRGKPPGTKNSLPTKPHFKSINWYLGKLEIDESYVFEATKETCNNIVRKASNITRRPETMKNMKFSCITYNAGQVGCAGGFTIFIKATRTE